MDLLAIFGGAGAAGADAEVGVEAEADFEFASADEPAGESGAFAVGRNAM